MRQSTLLGPEIRRKEQTEKPQKKEDEPIARECKPGWARLEIKKMCDAQIVRDGHVIGSQISG